MSFEGGPYIQVACLCELLIEDKTGVASVIRIIDTLTHTQAGPNPPEDMPPVPFNMKLVLMFKSGRARGRFNLRMVPQLPTGETKEGIIATVHFEGEEKGVNFAANMAFVFEHEGLYWFNVYLDDEKLTAIPFRVKYNRIVTTGG
jgi:hypothetical protein